MPHNVSWFDLTFGVIVPLLLGAGLIAYVVGRRAARRRRKDYERP